MNAYAKGRMKEVEYTVEDGRTVYVRGIVSFGITGSVTQTHDAMSCVESPDMQVRTECRALPATKDHIKHTLVLKEDVRVPQSMPRADKILHADAYATVGTVKTEDLKIIVEGSIKMMVVYLSEDKSAPLQYFYESIPYGEILPSESASDGDIITADADMYLSLIHI